MKWQSKISRRFNMKITHSNMSLRSACDISRAGGEDGREITHFSTGSCSKSCVLFTVEHLFQSSAFHSKVAITEFFFFHCITSPSTVTTSNWHGGGLSAVVCSTANLLLTTLSNGKTHTHAQTTTICFVLLAPSCFNWCCIHTRAETINRFVHPQKINQRFW